MNSRALRVLPMYFLLDCSGGMSGVPIESVRLWLRELLADFRTDPWALKTLYVSVIRFAGDAQQLCPLTSLMEFQEPELSVGGVVSMGSALRLLHNCLSAEVKKPSPTQEGDHRPIVFLIARRLPTDNWLKEAERLRTEQFELFCAAGVPDTIPVLELVTDRVVELDEITPSTMRAFSESVTSSFRAMKHDQDVRRSLLTHDAERLPPFVWKLPQRISR